LRVSENRVLWRILGPKKGGSRGRLEELHDLYISPNVVEVIKSRRMRGGACSTYG